MYLLYNIFITLAFLIFSPYLFIRALIEGHGVSERLGRLPKNTKDHLFQKEVIWFHAASVGEVKILPPVIHSLKKKSPDSVVVVTSLTKTGKACAKKILEDTELVFYPPIDIDFFVKRVVKKIKPQALVLVETELWPNLIREAKRHRAKIAIINGRLSSKSFPFYFRFKRFFSEVLSFVDIFCMRTKRDSQRAIILGANPDKIKVLGNLKFDQILSKFSEYSKEEIKKSLGINLHSKLIVAGSIRGGEEAIILNAFFRLKKEFLNLSLIFAPRHMKRLKETEKILHSLGLKFIRKTELKNQEVKEDVILLDTLGELFSLYSCADVAFVGGSLVPKGGHNILEPAIFGVPVLFGPHTENFKFAKDILLNSGGGIMVKDGEELYQKLFLLLKDEKLKKNLGNRAKEAVQSQRGVSDETVELLLKSLAEK